MMDPALPSDQALPSRGRGALRCDRVLGRPHGQAAPLLPALVWFSLLLGGCGLSSGGSKTGDGAPERGAEGEDASDSGEGGATAGDGGGGDGSGEDGHDDGATDDSGAGGPACDVHLSPAAAAGGDGSRAAPWPALEQAAAEGLLTVAGSTVCLEAGHHGSPLLADLAFDPPLLLISPAPGEAVVDALRFERVQGVTVDGLAVDGSSTVDPSTDQRNTFLVNGDADTSRVTLRSVRVQSADSSETWTWQDWTDLAFSGIDFRGPDNHIVDSRIQNVHHAISVRGDGSTVTNNLVDNFGGDGIRGHGSGSTYEWNTVRDAYIDEYAVQHDDGFQAYRLDGEDLRIADVVIRHNRFLVFADPVTDFVVEQSLVGTLMQGIVITDGYADGWVVENNLVVNAQAHGITLYGGRNCRVQGNTVVRHPVFDTESGPWVRIVDQSKTGQANFDNIIRNNLTTMLTPWDYDATTLVEGNLEVVDPSATFVDAAAQDYRPAPGSAAVDAGIATDLVDVDLSGAPRLVGDAVDVGAFERQ